MRRSEFASLTVRSSGPEHPEITSRWVRLVLLEARLSFEHEMERERKLLDRELERFWGTRRAQHA
ncbi:MAG: hypothetical protein ACE5HP_01885 [Gemmatimonadota bacterium]